MSASVLGGDSRLVKPSPGGTNDVSSGSVHNPERPAGIPSQGRSWQAYGHSPLMKSANSLLFLVPYLRETSAHANPAQLRDYLAGEISAFEERARSAGVLHEHVIAARYALCTLLDETVAMTEWGSTGAWGRQSLLVMFQNETWGGEKFFQLLTRLAQNPVPNLDVIELMYVCLCLGMEGRYRVLDNGAAQLDLLRRRLLELIRKHRRSPERWLSGRWQGVVVPVKKAFALIPLWAFAIVALAVLMASYLFFSLRVNSYSDPVYGAIHDIRAKAPIVVIDRAAKKARFAGFLEQEIREGLVNVDEFENRSIITIRGDGLFASGNASVRSEFGPLLQRIGARLTEHPGRILVEGHTDNVPMRSVLFPSNWQLSLARAEAVKTMLAAQVGADRITVEGKSDSQPLVPNDSAANRTRNRRVTITLFVTRQ